MQEVECEIVRGRRNEKKEKKKMNDEERGSKSERR